MLDAGSGLTVNPPGLIWRLGALFMSQGYAQEREKTKVCEQMFAGSSDEEKKEFLLPAGAGRGVRLV
jgi:hypothetical protein